MDNDTSGGLKQLLECHVQDRGSNIKMVNGIWQKRLLCEYLWYNLPSYSMCDNKRAKRKIVNKQSPYQFSTALSLSITIVFIFSFLKCAIFWKRVGFGTNPHKTRIESIAELVAWYVANQAWHALVYVFCHPFVWGVVRMASFGSEMIVDYLRYIWSYAYSV